MLRFALLSTIVSTSCRETEARGHDVSAVPCDINSATLVPTSLCNFQFQSALVCIQRATRPGLSRSTRVCLTKALVGGVLPGSISSPAFASWDHHALLDEHVVQACECPAWVVAASPWFQVMCVDRGHVLLFV